MAAPKHLLTGFAKTALTTKPDPKKRLTIRDPESRGLFVRINPAGTRSWLAMAREPTGKQVWATIGDVAAMELAEAREKGREAVQRIKAGEAAAAPAVEPEKAPETFEEVAKDFLKKHVEKKALRSASEIERQFNRYIYPAWRNEPFASIKRRKVIELLDAIDENSGPVMADRVLATLRKLFNWRAARDEDYASPIVTGMRDTGGKERSRQRILSDDEIRALWADWATAGTFGAFLQTCLLTAQRRAKVLSMKWADIKDGVWTIPTEPREKVNAGILKLPKLAADIIAAQPVVEENPFVFAGRGKATIGNIGHDLAGMRKRVPAEERWTPHDLRRSARSLMARAGIRPEIAERTLGHVIAGVEGVYDRHSYTEEKAAALEALAALVQRILEGEADNVVQLATAR